MNFRRTGLAVLAVCVGIFLAPMANAQQNREYQNYSRSEEAIDEESLDIYSSPNSNYSPDYNYSPDNEYLEAYSDDQCSGGSCGRSSGSDLGLGQYLLDRPMQYFIGAEYIYARANFSEALAYVSQNTVATPPGEDFVEFNFDYRSSYSVYGGVRLNDCGSAIVFDYNRLQSRANFNAVADANTDYFGPYETNAVITGDSINGSADVDIQSYNLSFQKTIPLGSPLGCCTSCCDDTCCGNGCIWCPAWDITWSAGFRYDNVKWSRGTTAFDNSQSVPIQGNSYRTRMNFSGAGARVGLGGRRYFGRNGRFSVFANGNWSLLVGDVDIQTLVSSANVASAVVNNSGRRVIPITEIEAGASVHWRNWRLSSGYFITAWHDLGMRDEYVFEDGSGASRFQVGHYDDANILGFDGFFARAEFNY